MSKLTHKGIGMLLKHHGLDENCSDEDIKNCVNAAIGNSEEMLPEEAGDEGGAENVETVENRATDIANNPTVKSLQKQIADLTKKLNAAGDTVHNRNTARTPGVNPDEIGTSESELEGQAIANRAAELQKLHPGMTLPMAFKNAARELEEKKKAE